jgi:predicted transcriptional regulator
MSVHYSISLINQYLTQSGAPAPDKARVSDAKDYELLMSLYETNHQFGCEATKLSWQALKKTAPHLDRRPRYMNANSLKDIEIPRYASGGYPFYLRGMNVLVGPRGGGKSFLALDVSAKIAQAHPNNLVIYTAGEGLPSYVTRWEAWKKYYNTTLNNLIFWEGALQMLNRDEVAEFIDEFKPQRPVFLIVDTVARAMTGFNENDTQQMGEFIAMSEYMMHELNCGVLLVHHIGRAGVMRGSSALDGAADSVCVLARDEKTLILHNQFEKGGKNRYQVEMPSIALRLESVDVTINGKLENGAVVLPTEMPNQTSEVNLTAIQLQIIEAIEAGRATATEIITATNLSKSTVHENLSKLKKQGVLAQHPVTKAYQIESSKGGLS